MGVKLIILLGLLIGVLYCIHILVKDYQAITAAKVFRLIFKRDLTSPNSYKAHVRWGKILQYDTIQCTRFLFCDLGASEIKTHLREDFIYMLTLEAREEDVTALEVFKNAYNYGKSSRKELNEPCRAKYSACPFKGTLREMPDNVEARVVFGGLFFRPKCRPIELHHETKCTVNK